jgi:hypothetical protein
MFSDELAVKVSPKIGEDLSFFVSKEKVCGSIGSEGKVKVQTYREGATQWVVLPTENRVAIPVHDAELIAK